MALRRSNNGADPESVSPLFEVLQSFATDLESGVPVVAVKGELFEADHELVRRLPECFVEAGLPSWRKQQVLQQRGGR
jgi:hypothetical protein